MSFTDLPDIAIIQVMEKLDIPSLLTMRLVSKKLDKLHYQVKYLKEIKLKIRTTDYELELSPSNDLPNTQSDDFEELVKKLNELAINTPVHIIRVYMGTNLNEQCPHIIKALSNFKADMLYVKDDKRSYQEDHPKMRLSTLIAFASNMRRVKIGSSCITFTALHLRTLRVVMHNSKCKLEYFYLEPPSDDAYSTLSDCFGVTLERDVDYDEERETWILRAADESVELYHKKYSDYVIPRLHHFEDDLHTEISEDFIELTKCKIDEKADKAYKKVKWNHRYRWQW